jgi:hypothetical protein
MDIDNDSYQLGVNDAFGFMEANTLPATDKQKKFMRKLGLKVRKGMSLNEARIRISAVLEARKNFEYDEPYWGHDFL